MPPNMILCQVDQLRAFAMGCYGNPVVRTPNLDRLAAEGARFERAITNNPVCTPARSCLLSGQYARTCTGMTGNVFQDPPNSRRVRLLDPALPEVLRDAGYNTALIGKWHIDPQPQLVGFDTAIYPSVLHKYHNQKYFDETAKSRIVGPFNPEWETERVREFLAEQGDQPFFLHYNISLPHQPIGPKHLPERYNRMYDPERVPLRPNVPEEPPQDAHSWFSVYTSTNFWWRWFRNLPQNPDDIAPEDMTVRDLVAFYYGAVTCVDDLFGNMMDALRENGLEQNTIIVFISDHGDNLGSHGFFNKGRLIEESVRIPLLIWYPEAISPQVSTMQQAQTIDVMPTLLDLAGLAAPECVQGQSLAPILHGGADELPQNMVFIETPLSEIGVRTSRYKYGIKIDESSKDIVDDQYCFYDLQDDPFEQKNLIDAGQPAEKAAELRSRLLSWHRNTLWLEPSEPPPDWNDWEPAG